MRAGRTGLPGKHTYGEALQKWFREGAPESMKSHARNTRLHLDNVLLVDIVAAVSEMKGDMLEAGLSVQTINRRLAVVRRILNVAFEEWGWLSYPLAKRIKLYSEKGLDREVAFSRDEALALFKAVTDPEALKLIILAPFTGLRRSELRKMKPECWRPPYFVLPSKTKGKKPRTIPLIEELHPYVTLPFKSSEWDLRKAFEAARVAIGRPDVRLHDLRHVFATWLAEDPRIPLTLLRDLLGHSSLSITSKYAHHRKDTHDIVSAVLGGIVH